MYKLCINALTPPICVGQKAIVACRRINLCMVGYKKGRSKTLECTKSRLNPQNILLKILTLVFPCPSSGFGRQKQSNHRFIWRSNGSSPSQSQAWRPRCFLLRHCQHWRSSLPLHFHIRSVHISLRCSRSDLSSVSQIHTVTLYKSAFSPFYSPNKHTRYPVPSTRTPKPPATTALS